MDKSTAGFAVGVAGCVGALVAMLMIRGVASDVEDVTRRLTTIESTPSTSPAKDASRAELDSLRLRIATLEERPVTRGPVTGPTVLNPNPPTVIPAPGPTPEERKIAEEKRQREWLAARANQVGAWLEQTLGLTAQQKQQATDLASACLGSMTQSKGTPEEVQKRNKELSAELEKRIREQLTSEQATAFDTLLEKPGGIFAHAFSRESPNSGPGVRVASPDDPAQPGVLPINPPK